MTKYMKSIRLLSALLTSVLFALPTGLWASAQSDDLVQAGDLINNVYEQKRVTKTGRDWDLAITGGGFFPLQDSQTGEMLYTRLGHFELGRDGIIILANHPRLRLLLQQGSQTVPLNLLKWMHFKGAPLVGFAINDDEEAGTLLSIYSNGEILKVANLVLAKFFNNEKLTAVEPHILKAEAAALPFFLGSPTDKGLGAVIKGSLEQL